MANEVFLMVGGGVSGTAAVQSGTSGQNTLDMGPGLKYTSIWHKFNGTTGLYSDNNTDYSLNSSITGDFTLEFWYVGNTVQPVPVSTVADIFYLGGNESISVTANSYVNELQVSYTPVPYGSGPVTVSLGTIGLASWIVIQRTVADGKLAIYRDGVRLFHLNYGTSEDRDPYAFSFTPSPAGHQAVIDEVRLSDVARYTSSGVSPASITVQSASFAPLAASNNVSLTAPSPTLVATGTTTVSAGTADAPLTAPSPTITFTASGPATTDGYQDNVTFAANFNLSNGLAVDLMGNTLSTFEAPTLAVMPDGSQSLKCNIFDGHLIIDNPAIAELGAEDFCIEMVAHRLGDGSLGDTASSALFSSRIGSDTSQTIFLGVRPSTFGTPNVVYLYVNGVLLCTSTTGLSAAATHVAIARSAGTTRLFINGVMEASAVDTNVYVAGPAGIGGKPTVATTTYGAFNGYIDDVRVTAGVPRYTSNFAPTIPFIFDIPSESATAALTSPSPSLVFSASEGAGVYNAVNVAAICPSPVVTIVGGSSAALTAPSPTLFARAHDSTGEQAANLTAPSPTLTFTTGAVARALRAPKPTLSAAGTVTTLASATLKAPKPTLSAAGTVTALARAALTAPSPSGLVSFGGATASGSAPSPSLAAAMTVGSVAHVAAAAPKPTLAIHAGASVSLQPPRPTLSSSILVGGQINASVSTPSPNLVGYGGAVLSVTSITGKYTLVSTGTTGGIGGAQLECPMFELMAEATTQNHGSAHLIAPSPKLGQTIQAWLVAPGAKLTAIGSAVVTATYEAYAVNLKHTADSPDEVTRYTNFPFTHVVRYKNSYYGANNTGLFLLEGTTDEAAPIPWSVKTAMTDFKTPVKKTVASAYFAGRFGPASTVALQAGEDTANTYTFSTPRDRLAQNHRQVFGKGVKERYYALSASGTDVVQLDAVELDVVNTTRRI